MQQPAISGLETIDITYYRKEVRMCRGEIIIVIAKEERGEVNRENQYGGPVKQRDVDVELIEVGLISFGREYIKLRGRGE